MLSFGLMICIHIARWGERLPWGKKKGEQGIGSLGYDSLERIELTRRLVEKAWNQGSNRDGCAMLMSCICGLAVMRLISTLR